MWAKQLKLLHLLCENLTRTHNSVLLTNRSSLLLHQLPLISPLIQQNKITVNPLVSSNGVPTALLLQGSTVPSGLPGSQEYREVLTAYTPTLCLSLSDFLFPSHYRRSIFALHLHCILLSFWIKFKLLN